MSRKYLQPCWWSGTVSGQAVVDRVEGGRVGLLDQVDLDGRAPGRHAEAAVLPALPVGEVSRRRTSSGYDAPSERLAGYWLVNTPEGYDAAGALRDALAIPVGIGG
jgi:hypothetical protein